jgi:hypothetical protein
VGIEPTPRLGPKSMSIFVSVFASGQVRGSPFQSAPSQQAKGGCLATPFDPDGFSGLSRQRCYCDLQLKWESKFRGANGANRAPGTILPFLLRLLLAPPLLGGPPLVGLNCVDHYSVSASCWAKAHLKKR